MEQRPWSSLQRISKGSALALQLSRTTPTLPVWAKLILENWRLMRLCRGKVLAKQWLRPANNGHASKATGFLSDNRRCQRASTRLLPSYGLSRRRCHAHQAVVTRYIIVYLPFAFSIFIQVIVKSIRSLLRQAGRTV